MKEAARVAKLEKRERALKEKKLTKGDLALAETLAQDIDREEEALRELERKDRRLAQQLVKNEGDALKNLPQTEEKLRTLSRQINGEAPPSVRTRLRARLNSLRGGISKQMDECAPGAAPARKPLGVLQTDDCGGHWP